MTPDNERGARVAEAFTRDTRTSEHHADVADGKNTDCYLERVDGKMWRGVRWRCGEVVAFAGLVWGEVHAAIRIEACRWHLLACRMHRAAEQGLQNLAIAFWRRGERFAAEYPAARIDAVYAG